MRIRESPEVVGPGTDAQEPPKRQRPLSSRDQRLLGVLIVVPILLASSILGALALSGHDLLGAIAVTFLGPAIAPARRRLLTGADDPHGVTKVLDRIGVTLLGFGVATVLVVIAFLAAS